MSTGTPSATITARSTSFLGSNRAAPTAKPATEPLKAPTSSSPPTTSTVRRQIRPPGSSGAPQAHAPAYSTPGQAAPQATAPANVSNPAAPPPPPYPSLHLHSLNDTFQPKQISLVPIGKRVKIGRYNSANTVPYPTNGFFDSKVLSRLHAEIWSDGQQVYIQDVKSSNGTFIDGNRLSMEGTESDVFELKTGFTLEFGIDIVSDDGKTIFHHRVAARVIVVLNPEDVAYSSRELSVWYKNTDASAPHHPRRINHGPTVGRPPEPPVNNGLNVEHVLTQLQTELQKSRDTNNQLSDLTSTLGDVHDTLGGGVPPPPDFARNAGASGRVEASVISHSQSISALQHQLSETQTSLASHVNRMRDLEILLAEHDNIKVEVGTLRKEVEDTQKDMTDLLKTRDVATSLPRDGRESPVAAQLENDSDDDDNASISSYETIRGSMVNNKSIAKSRSSMPSFDAIENLVAGRLATSVFEEKERELREQNAKLTERLGILSTELEEATKLGESLRAKHIEAAATTQTLLAKVQKLEEEMKSRAQEAESKMMEAQGKVVEAEGKAAEVATRWDDWRKSFEENWKKERAGWDEERERLLKVVQTWEENRQNSEKHQNERAGESAGEESDQSRLTTGTQEEAKESKTHKANRRNREKRKKRAGSQVSNPSSQVSSMTSDPTTLVGESDKDDKKISSEKGVSVGTYGLTTAPGGPMVPAASAGMMVIVAIAAAWAVTSKYAKPE